MEEGIHHNTFYFGRDRKWTSQSAGSENPQHPTRSVYKSSSREAKRGKTRRETKTTSCIGVAKFSTHRVHNVLNRDVLPQAIPRDHRAQLWNVSTATTGAHQPGGFPRTLRKGGAPVGYSDASVEFTCQLTEPPPNAFSLLEFLCCQSYQTLSTI